MSASNRNLYQRVDALDILDRKSHLYEMSDQYLIRFLAVTAGYQRCLSLHHCSRLSYLSFAKLSSCISLWCLDLSYTNIDDLTPIQCCVSLRSLILSGTKVEDYSPVGELYDLELLHMNFSSVKSIDIASNLTKLRSLNLGFTAVADVTPISTCTRIEALYLDKTAISSTEDLICAISPISNLRSLNIALTRCVPDINLIRRAVPRAVVTEYSTSYYFFRAVIVDDSEIVADILSSGFDVNTPTDGEIGPLVLKMWQEKCMSQTVFFDVNHPEIEQRPRAFHMAVFFNSAESLKVIVKANVNYNLDVWLNAVIPDPDNLDPSTRCLVQKLKRRKPVDSSGDDPNDIKKGVRFARRIGDCGIYRVLERLGQRRIGQWRELCEVYTERLVTIIRQEEPDPGPPNIRDFETARGKVFKSVPSASASNGRNHSMYVSGTEEGSKGMDDRGVEAGDEPATDADVDGNAADNLLIPDAHEVNGDNEAMDLDGEVEEISLGPLTSVHSLPGVNKVRHPTSTSPEHTPTAAEVAIGEANLYFNQHAMVRRLRFPVRILGGPDGNADLSGQPATMLGNRSFFEESFAQTVRARERKVEQQLEQEQLNPRPKSRQKALYADVEVPDETLSYYFQPPLPDDAIILNHKNLRRTMFERREIFYNLIDFDPNAKKKKTKQFT